MSSNISPLDSLRKERMALKEECRIDEKRIVENLHYVRDNFGILLISSALSAPKNGLKFLFGADKGENSFFNSRIMSALPVVWSLAQPFVIGWITKRISSFLFGSRKKTRK